jgi:hypothetical protein
MTALGRRTPLVLLALGTLALMTGCLGRSKVTVVNRTTEDIVVRFGFQFQSGALVPACDEVSFTPNVRHEPPDVPATTPELQIRFSLPPDAPGTATLTITSERVWTYVSSPPPCEGLAPMPTLSPPSTGG